MDVQYACEGRDIPSVDEFRSWVEAVLGDDRTPEADPDTELTVRIVDEAEGARLNENYRGRVGPTNVLSFPFEPPEEIPLQLLGDVVICVPVVEREAAEQGKGLRAHWAHMVVHGTLHLFGYRHTGDNETMEMEQLETGILARLGFPDPYTDQQAL